MMLSTLPAVLATAIAMLNLVLCTEANSARLHQAQLHRRDAFSDQDPINNEGEDHSKPVVPSGASLVSFPVSSTAQLATYWTSSPKNSTATNAYIMMHGKLRDGANYWSILNDAVNSAVAAKYPTAPSTSIITAPEFYSTQFNSGQYTSKQLGWADTNVWQAGESANHPTGVNFTSFDALDALLAEFSDTQKYPQMKQITFVGHGGGGQLISRYSVVGAGLPSTSKISLRYVVGDPSSNPYFTLDRPLNDTTVANVSTCPAYNTWRYGFNKFNGTSQGKSSIQDYFSAFAKRDVRWVVGYQDTAPDGDNTCMAKLQGGAARRDRNLSWWRYLNTLAGTNQDLTGFPGSLPSLTPWTNLTQGQLNHRLTVVYTADHNASEVFGSPEGRSALFDDTNNVLLGWRPQGWKNVTSTASNSSSNSPSSAHSSSSAVALKASAPWLSLLLPSISTACVLALVSLTVL